MAGLVTERVLAGRSPGSVDTASPDRATGRRKRKRRPVQPTAGWTVRYAIGAYCVVLAVGVVLAIALSHSQLRLGIGVLAVDSVMLACFVPLNRKRPVRVRDVGLRKALPTQSVGLVFLAVIVIAIVNLIWLQGVLGFRAPDSLGVTLHENTTQKILTGFAIGLCAPVVEEIFFRGLLYRALRNKMSVARAALIAGVLFGAIHGITYPLDTLPPRVVFGVIACLLYEQTGSLLPGIALHCLIDAGGFELAVSGHNRIVFPAFAALGAVLLLYSGVQRIRLRKGHDPSVPQRPTS